MAKLPLNTIGSRYGSVDALNANFDAIEEALNNTLSRDGTTPNAMEAPLDMNGNAILNASSVNTSSLKINGRTVEPADVAALSTATVQVFETTAFAGQTSFSIFPVVPFSATSLLVEVNGTSLPTSSVSLSGSTVSFPALQAGDEVVIRVFVRDMGAAPTAADVVYTPLVPLSSSRTVRNKLSDVLSAQDFNAVGDGVTDDTAALQLFLNAGGGYIPTGTYSVNDLVITAPVNVVCGPNVLLKRRSVTGTNTIVTFSAGSEGSYWEGGTFDGNDDLWPSWTYAGIFNDWKGVFVNAARISLHNVEFQNFTNHPLVAPGNYLRATSLTFRLCGTGPIFGWNVNTTVRPANVGAVGQHVDGLTLIEVGNIGIANTLQHIFDTYGCKGGVYTNILMLFPSGRDDGQSYAVSGHTDKLSEDCVFSNFVYDSPVGENVQHVAYSYVGSFNCIFDKLNARNYCGLGLELLDVSRSTVSNVVLDGNYRETSYQTAATSKGVSVDRGKFLIAGNLSRGIVGGFDNVVSNVVVTRVGLGFDIKAGKTTYSQCKVIGCIGTGIQVTQAIPPEFPGAAKTHSSENIFAQCVSEYNGAQGISVVESGVVSIDGGSYSNNGQNTTLAATTRSGVVASIADKLTVCNARLSDSQTFTVEDGASFAPGTTSNNQYVVSLHVSHPYSCGQRISLVNAGGAGVTHTGKIVNIDDSLTTLEFDSVVSFVSTGNTIALSGTWSGSGTTLTGVGTSAIAQLPGPVYVTNGSEWRRVIRVVSDTSIILDSAFSSALSGATISKLTVDVVGIPSQQYGTRIFGNVTTSLLKGLTAYGNVLEKTLVSNLSSLAPGSEYWRKSTVNPTTASVDLITSIYNGHRVAGWTTWNSAAISGGGATSYSVVHTNSGGTTKETLGSGLSLSLNQKHRGNAQGNIVATDDKIVATFAGGTPTAGTLVTEVFFKCDLPELL